MNPSNTLSATPICPASMLDTADHDPFPMLEEWRALGPVVRDEKMNAWLVFDYALCKKIEADEMRFSGMYVNPTAMLAEIKGGQGNITLSQGEAHDKLRRFHLKLLSQPSIQGYRETAIKPIIEYFIARIEKAGRAELAGDLAAQIPPCVIFALLGLPWQNETLVQRTLDLHKDLIAYFGNNYPEGELQRRALAASRELHEILLPYIRDRKMNRRNDLISQIWSEAPDVYGEMTEDIAMGICREIFLGGSDTTAHGIANSFYLLLTRPDLHAALKDNRELVRPFVEETLRLYPAPQWRTRISVQDYELNGIQIKAGDRLVLAHAAANRDASKFSCPAAADLSRETSVKHLTFNYGPRSCPGQGLARAEMQDTLTAALDRLPNLRLDPEAEPPRMTGLFMASFKPLQVLFDAL